ncbi:MAG TPA: HAMP domain-containing sensor histidine kinase [Chitinophaga sp.]|uniref:sensor histidine kinase n=1 Tax=Chitinophaga sp. TaxID=1869181 RepID=UPI002C4BD8D0|nr:HAMP domain-containing sensor histidine kinase [Chitinophaga sp.]HVI48050.1 HAMP domain-containing sensor histidine kinase [Chitinophaga sp.]
MAIWLWWGVGLLQAQRNPADSLCYVDKLNHTATAYLYRQLDSSFVYVNKAQQAATMLGYTRGKAVAWLTLGRYYSLRSNYYLAARYYLDALKAFQEIHDNAGICLINACLAVYYQQSKQSVLAAQYIDKAVYTARGLWNDSVYAITLASYAMVNINDAEKKDSATWAIRTARNIFSRYRDTASLLQLDLLEAQVSLPATAGENKLTSVINQAAAGAYRYPAMEAYRLLALHVPEKGRSVHYLTQMVDLAIAGGYRELMLPYAIQLYDWYMKQGQPSTAARYSSLLLDIFNRNDAVKSNGEMDYISYYTQQHNINALQLSHDTQQAILQRSQLENSNRLHLIVALVIIILLTALLGIYFYRSYKKNQRYALLLAVKNEEVSEKNITLQRHDDFKNKLVSMIAHDFRSPLSNIINITTFLKEEMLTTEEAAEWMQEVESTTGNTLKTFDNILTWINSQLSGFSYDPQPCTPAIMITETLQYFESFIHEKKLQVEVDIPSSVTVFADHEMLQFIHRNFIHNAIKFSPSGGTIIITAGMQDDDFMLSVADEGPGISADILPCLFEFSRSKSGKGENRGAGLALIICKDFMDKMKGRLHGGNRQQGGAVLSYTLPPARLSSIKKGHHATTLSKTSI